MCRDYGAEVAPFLLVKVSRVASGGQAKRIGAYGEVPMPAETCLANAHARFPTFLATYSSAYRMPLPL